MFFSLPLIGSISFTPSTLLSAHPTLVYEVAGHAIGHALFGFFKRNRKKRGLSRSQMRKMSNRRRRQFVDNIIMHHQRLANLNRQTLVSNARERALARHEKIKRKANNREAQGRSFSFEREEDMKKRWQQHGSKSLKERGKALRGMADARRVRARSRWLSVVAQKA